MKEGCTPGEDSHVTHMLWHIVFFEAHAPASKKRDHSFICGSRSPKVPNKRPEMKRQAQRPLTNIPSSKAKHYHRAISWQEAHTHL